MGEITERYPAAKWKVGSRPAVIFPIRDITETGGNRIVPQERAGRDGAKLDDTGSKPRTWSFTALFGNRFEEPDVPGPLYPDALRAFIRSFDIHETGTLTLPTVGDVRARAQDYTRRDTPDDDDFAILEVVFVQDNEDALDRAELSPPAVKSTVVKLAELTQFTAQSEGTWNDDMKSLREVCSELEGLISAPGRSVADIGAIVKSHRLVLQSLVGTASTEARNGSQLERTLRLLIDREAQSEDERSRSRPRTKPFVVDVERTSMYEIAARLNQDVTELMDLNAARVDDPFDLTRGQVLRVYESTPR